MTEASQCKVEEEAELPRRERIVATAAGAPSTIGATLTMTTVTMTEAFGGLRGHLHEIIVRYPV